MAVVRGEVAGSGSRGDREEWKWMNALAVKAVGGMLKRSGAVQR